MSKDIEKLWIEILTHPKNRKFNDFLRVITWFGFVKKGGKGSHQTFTRKDIKELIDVQPLDKEAKSYQIKQFIRIVKLYNLKGGK